MQITTVGLDIAKNVFQVHGIDAKEKVVVRKQLRRSQVIAFFTALPPCLIGMEACATAHYWARELTKLGHEVRLMPAKDVKAYVKRNKNDAADAEAICEAVRRLVRRFRSFQLYFLGLGFFSSALRPLSAALIAA
jgi:transposase